MESFLAILIFLSITIAVSFVLHYYIKRLILGSLLSAIASTLIYQAIGMLVMGYLDPFFLIAFIFGTLISLGISFAVGLGLMFYNTKK